MKKITVIVVACGDDGNCYGSQATFDCLPNEGVALRAAKPFCQDGLAVIVRPSYNDDDSSSFHEFRSFNGSELKRVDFTIAASRAAKG